MQSHVPDEMSTFSHELDLSDLAKTVQDAFRPLNIFDMLFLFADLERSPDPRVLADKAVDAIKKHPLISLFSASTMDRDGKVIHRSKGGGFGDGEDSSAVIQQIAQNESIRRKIVASGKIQSARFTIIERFYISEELIASLLRYSPFVPENLLGTFSRGFARLFHGDFVSATYILTPLLENSLRHVLRSNGFDVSIFDDVTQTQQNRTFSSLYDQMHAELDSVLSPAIADEIERLFLNKPGPHLRHALAHGLLADEDPYGADAIYGCWFIFRLCLLPLFPYREKLKFLFAFIEG